MYYCTRKKKTKNINFIIKNIYTLQYNTSKLYVIFPMYLYNLQEHNWRSTQCGQSVRQKRQGLWPESRVVESGHAPPYVEMDRTMARTRWKKVYKVPEGPNPHIVMWNSLPSIPWYNNQFLKGTGIGKGDAVFICPVLTHLRFDST